MVTTPQQVAIADVRRNLHLFRQVSIPVLGIVENMSYLPCDRSDEQIQIFGSGGAKQLAEELHAPLLGQVPIDSHICNWGDRGQPIVIAEPKSTASQVFIQVAALDATFYPSVSNAAKLRKLSS